MNADLQSHITEMEKMEPDKGNDYENDYSYYANESFRWIMILNRNLNRDFDQSIF